MNDALLTLRDVHVCFPAKRNWRGKVVEQVHALNGLDLTINDGETLGVVGESGCGKSTLSQVLMGMLSPSQSECERARSPGSWLANGMQMVFQDPLSSLDPRLPVWRTITEPVWLQGHGSETELRALACELATLVGIRHEYLDRLPHAFSGGQRQRIAIARALSAQPDIILLDEPTSALDISVQAQILNLLVMLQRQRKLTYVLISHNISVIRHMSDRVAVMYLGQIVELGTAHSVLNQPRHPYTRLLLESVPRLDRPLLQQAGEAMKTGELPSNRRLPQGCFFRERCPYASADCGQSQLLTPLNETDGVRCWRAAAGL
ncbi:peptide ABC transporter ATP-binding protein [Candidatus Symbiopectobacterium sp. 'North America']|uniref:ABC transporter ATP-binding protein n=1 Tax=Candidatus Symbiopectobacterium sp. 'North America' TaxID=2794574 RepID=UPI0018CAB43E|nr:ABC transporter ATP-binding protein [Candidatus Symbiopectobacterium sp. 'North America']MBG6244941.1 peptide ABC transporter ATP-binding protein [Candidatus Symbiopectobacterium sp. 'North America']